MAMKMVYARPRRSDNRRGERAGVGSPWFDLT
uniref:Uncharacterized protein n=1 Tax=Arundo donax TaxID=35708 RepID=A0A0A9BGK9_ARUDO